jgi:cytochrome P450
MNAVKRLEDFEDADFDPFVADEAMFGACLDPYPKLAALRDKGPVHALNYRVYMGEYPDRTSNDVEHFTVVGYDEVAARLRDLETFSNKAYMRNIGISFGRSVSTMDAPEHPRFRKIRHHDARAEARLRPFRRKGGQSVVDSLAFGQRGVEIRATLRASPLRGRRVRG